MKNIRIYLLLLIAIFAFGCEKNTEGEKTVITSTLQGVPALKLNFRFENDVPAPPADTKPKQTDEKKWTICKAVIALICIRQKAL